MATNGQPHLEAGPEAGWLGHYSLDKAGRLASGDSLETLITEAGDSGLIWTDPQVKWVELFVMLNLSDVRLTQPSVDIEDTSLPPALSASPFASTIQSTATGGVWAMGLDLTSSPEMANIPKSKMYKI